MATSVPFGRGDTTFNALGGEAGITRLVDDFYDIMGTNPAFATIWSWHPADNQISRDKLARFLCGWTGGPRLYQDHYGPINIPQVHAHLTVSSVERDQWLACMQLALDRQQLPGEVVAYVIAQLSIPAERIRQRTQAGSDQ